MRVGSLRSVYKLRYVINSCPYLPSRVHTEWSLPADAVVNYVRGEDVAEMHPAHRDEVKLILECDGTGQCIPTVSDRCTESQIGERSHTVDLSLFLHNREEPTYSLTPHSEAKRKHDQSDDVGDKNHDRDLVHLRGIKE